MKNISSYFNLPNGKGHKSYNFVDVNLFKDNRLFIDALLCQCRNDKYSIETQKTLDSFMKNIFSSIKNCEIEKQKYLLSNFDEVKETYLGMSMFSNYGKGASYEILLPIFKKAMEVLGETTGVALIPVVADNFDKDRMSDLISRLCLKVLYEFTISECEKHNIPLSEKEHDIGYYWCLKNNEWALLRGRIPTYNGKPTLFTPKSWVCSSSILNPQSFLSVEWAAYRQLVHLNEKSSLSQYFTKDGKVDYKKPSKVDVKLHDLSGKVYKDVICGFVKMDVGQDYLNKFFERKYKSIEDSLQQLSDEELDKKIYDLEILKEAI